MKSFKKFLAVILVIVIQCSILLTSCQFADMIKGIIGDDDFHDDSAEGSSGEQNNPPMNPGVDDSDHIQEEIISVTKMLCMPDLWGPNVVELGYGNSGLLLSIEVTRYEEYEKCIIDFTYNQHGKIIEATVKDGIYMPEMMYKYVYDQSADVSYAYESTVEYYQSGKVSSICFDYNLCIYLNENGNVSAWEDGDEIITFIYEGNSQNPTSMVNKEEEQEFEVAMEYGDFGILSLTAPDDYYFSKAIFEYDDVGRIVGQKVSFTADGYYDYTKIKYDGIYTKDIAELCTERYVESDFTVLDAKLLVELAYDKGLLITMNAKLIEAENELQSFAMTMEYNESGKITNMINQSGLQKYEYAYEYDGIYTSKEMYSYYGESGDLKRISCTEYKRDGYGRVTEETKYNYDEDCECIGKAVYEYTYNDLQERTTVSVSTYDADGNLINKR